MYDQEFYSDLEKFNREYYKNKLLTETVHPIDIINENAEVLSEAFNGKNNIAKLIADLIYKMQKSVNKFIDMSSELFKRNGKLIESFKKVNLNSVDFSNFEYEIHDLKTALNNISKISIPNYNDSDMDILLNNNALEYKQRNFPGMFTEDGQLIKDYFNGTVKNSENGMMKVSGNMARDVFNAAIDVLEQRNVLAKKIPGMMKRQEQLVSSLTKNNQNVNTESVLYNTSIFKDEYIDILLEDAVTTPNDIKREEKNEAKGIVTDPEQSQTDNNNNRRIDAVLKFNEIVCNILNTSMASLDSLYGEAIKYCSRVTQLSNKNNK